MQQQHQEQQESEHDILESYHSAQRAGAEALAIGAATLQQASHQGEQLQRAENIADETQYSLEKAGRILRGMTWTGWVANLVTKDATAPSITTKESEDEVPLVYEHRPESCRAAAQAIQNYHANINVLQACETDEQRETCRMICNDMYQVAHNAVKALQEKGGAEAYAAEFEKHVEILRQRQTKMFRSTTTGTTSATSSSPEQAATTAATTTTTPSKPTTTLSPALAQVKQRQDDHLNIMFQNLAELGDIADSLHHAINQQNVTIDNLESKNDDNVELSKRVTRRADRLVNSKSWGTVKPTYVCRLSIRHVESGKYLAVVNSDLYLVPTFRRPACVFVMWKRKKSSAGGGSALFGLQSKATGKWVGQTMFGNLACSATSFSRREEWQADDDNNKKNTATDDWTQSRTTTLLCASAGWGAGGYLMVRPRDSAVLIGTAGGGAEEKKKAAIWCLEQQVDDVPSE